MSLALTLSSLFLALVLSIFSLKKVPAWEARGFGDRNFKWKTLIASSGLSSVLASHAAFFLSQNLWVSLSIGLLAFLVILSSVTDIALLKIPGEPSILTYWIPVPFIALFWPSLDLFTMAVWGIITFIFMVTSYFRMFGWGDIRLLIVFGTTLSWWVGFEYMLYALMAACVLQLILFPVTKKLGIGVHKSIAEKMQWNPETKKMESVSHLSEEEQETLTEEELKKKTGKKRHYVPFGPALLISYLVMAFFAAAKAPAMSSFMTWFG